MTKTSATPRKTVAFCDATGTIEFGPRVLKGRLPIIRGTDEKVREIICATARHAYDGETLIVPGVPEADDQMAAVDALIRYRDWIKPRLSAAS